MIIPNTIHILGFSKNKLAGEKAINEVRRIGKNPEIFWNISSRWDSFCIKHLTKIPEYMKQISAFSCTRGHYHILQNAIDFNEQSVWIIEDDTRFLKDVGKFNQILKNFPKDADILILDSLAAGKSNSDNVKAVFNKIHKTKLNGWWEVDREDLRNCGNYIIGKKALKRYAEIATRGCDGKNVYAIDTMRNHNWFPYCKIYSAYPNLSIQVIDPSGKHMASNDLLNERYKTMKININNYEKW